MKGSSYRDRDYAFGQTILTLRTMIGLTQAGLADRLLLSLPPWIPPADSLDDWQTTAWDNLLPSTRQTLIRVMHSE